MAGDATSVTHPRHARPELLATRPTSYGVGTSPRLLGPATWTYYYLYVVMDVFSRYVVGWMVAHAEQAVLAEQLLAATTAKQLIKPGQLTVRRPRQLDELQPIAFLLADLGVTKTHSLRVSQRQPLFRGQFKTLKYRPGFPDRFGSLQDARSFCQQFFTWYNRRHRHAGIAMMTPEAVHSRAPFHQARAQVLAAATPSTPGSACTGRPHPNPCPPRPWINRRSRPAGDSVNNSAWRLRIVDRLVGQRPGPVSGAGV